MAAELGLAIAGLVGVVDICIKLSGKVMTTCRTFRNVERDIDNKVFILESILTKCEIQLDLVRRISDHLGEDLVHMYMNQVQKFQGMLGQALSQLGATTSTASTKSSSDGIRIGTSAAFGKWEYTFIKKGIDTLLGELEAWQGRFDPSWYLITLISRPILNRVLFEAQDDQAQIQYRNSGVAMQKTLNPLDSLLALHHAKRADMEPKALEISITQLTDAQDVHIPFSAARVVVKTGSSEILLVEAVDTSIRMDSQCKLGIQSLARKLQYVDPGTFGLLRCEGIHLQPDLVNGGPSTVEIVYKAPLPLPFSCLSTFMSAATASEPLGYIPRTLRQLLLSPDMPPPSLTSVLRLAKQLIRSVCFLHVFDFVHKNIRPDNIIVFPNETSLLGDGYLVGFSQFHNVNFQTNTLGDNAWHRNLYRHPTRQGLCVLQPYVMQHDIYSLGVCLLEIGIWQSFVSYSNYWGAAPTTAQALGLSLTDQDFAKAHLATPLWVQQHLVELSRRLLPSRVGNMYTDVVLACLTCLDDGNSAFGNEADIEDSHGIVVGARFVEKILARASEIVV